LVDNEANNFFKEKSISLQKKLHINIKKEIMKANINLNLTLKYLKIAALLFITPNIWLSAQNTIVNPNSSWATLCYGVGAYYPPSFIKTEYVFFDGDSIVEGKSFKKVFMCDDELHGNVEYQGIMREQNLKTYFIPHNSEIEYLLYDFSLEQGMSLEY
jgi:hypothetical protein